VKKALPCVSRGVHLVLYLGRRSIGLPVRAGGAAQQRWRRETASSSKQIRTQREHCAQPVLGVGGGSVRASPLRATRCTAPTSVLVDAARGVLSFGAFILNLLAKSWKLVRMTRGPLISKWPALFRGAGGPVGVLDTQPRPARSGSSVPRGLHRSAHYISTAVRKSSAMSASARLFEDRRVVANLRGCHTRRRREMLARRQFG